MLSCPQFSITVQPPSSPSPGRATEQQCLNLLHSTSSLPKLLQALAFLLKSGLHSNLLVLTRFAAAAGFLGPVATATAAALLFSPCYSPLHLYDSFLLNTVLQSLSPSPLHPLSLFSLMLRLRLSPNHFTFPFLLKAIAALPSPLPAASLVHASALRFGLVRDSFVQNTLIHAYAAAGGVAALDLARKVFDETPKSSPVTFSAMIGGYILSGRSNDAVALFRQMQLTNIRPDDVTILTILSACVDLGALDLTEWLKSYIERVKIPKSLYLCNALVDALAKCGDVDSAMEVFDEMPERNIVSWTSVIDGLAMHGRGVEAVQVFEDMKNTGVEPDAVAFIGVLKACSHGGLVRDGRRYFNSMTREFEIEPRIEHYGCMVDLFSRAGKVEEAMEFVRAMPIKPNPVIWRTLIAACRVYGRLELGEKVTKQLIKEEPLYGSNYILLSNFYALNRRWEKKWEIRKSMEGQGMRKVPGFSSFELNGEIYEFVAGGEKKKLSQFQEIYEMVEEIAKKLKGAGYMATTSEILLDIDEEDKEDALHWHSEKLAIAFALLKTPPGTKIRIVKNLRVCGDCHSATKFISKVYQREIVVRDRSRFHCFKDGICSCKDFW
ncbi:pentatricopeptide repeat-containing protein At4g21065 [Dendrobium catenatum]|uniref:Pentatricopeptide repeat-containing protein n=1 Tax=Dendrobium catenatum TaxID=906689 RepID=A0A2I0X8T3_9ASPA|nr:pentatricopeptide repeat-containing protein At4g21065 [Dendrobium catenatum]PKU84301.1 Pentatricopeptide repeat-containing protein [Dendrobium catenatum]